MKLTVDTLNSLNVTLKVQLVNMLCCNEQFVVFASVLYF